jgi:hypothetical protein
MEKTAMLFIVIEHFRGNSAAKAYRRFNEHGRLAPDGLKTLGSWVTADLSRCIQIVEADEISTIQRWVANWSKLIQFEVLPALPGSAVAEHFPDGIEVMSLV